MPRDLALPAAPKGRPAIPRDWQRPLLQLACAGAGLLVLTAGDWAEMARQWWNASTYNHILLIPPVLAWLVRLRWTELSRLSPSTWWPGLLWLGAGLLTWVAGTIADINLFAQAGAVVMLQAAVMALLGPRVAYGLLFPLGYMLFLVPFGDEIVPALQLVTAHIAVALSHASGVAAQLDGVLIATPGGLFKVAEACSGVKFLVAMVALGALAAHLGFVSWKRRALFMAAAVVVPILANGVRAWGTIYIAQSQGVQFAAGFDHIVYGWIFFALVMAALLGAAWRCFDRSPHDPLVDVPALLCNPWLARVVSYRMPGWAAVAAVLALAGGSALLGDAIRLPDEAFLAAAAGQP
ncbi:MAG: exosortase A [Croceibacterium sp.]